ncbi:Protein glass, partial [Gryllus bimaculatus]
MANSLEEVMQRRLKDYLQSAENINGYVEDYENLLKELEDNVKQEPDDDPQEEAYDFTEGDDLCPLKREMKMEDDEEELKPPIRVFLVPEEVPSGEVIQAGEDPLASGTEIFRCKSEMSAGGECNTTGDFSDSKFQIRHGVGCTPSCNDENYVVLGEKGVKGCEGPVRKEESVEIELQSQELNSAKRVDEQPVLSKSGCEVGLDQKEKGGNEYERCRRRQIQIQSADGSHECHLCQKRSSTRKSNLLAQMKAHSDEHRHQCSLCQKGFTESSHLVRHMRIHSGERPHKCSVCQKCFTVSSNLVAHMRIHSGECPYKCSVCEKTFTERSNLVRHMRIHSGERPYKCSVCQKCFTESSPLVRHMRIH